MLFVYRSTTLARMRDLIPSMSLIVAINVLVFLFLGLYCADATTRALAGGNATDRNLRM